MIKHSNLLIKPLVLLVIALSLGFYISHEKGGSAIKNKEEKEPGASVINSNDDLHSARAFKTLVHETNPMTVLVFKNGNYYFDYSDANELIKSSHNNSKDDFLHLNWFKFN